MAGELIDQNTLKSMTPDKARIFAKQHNFPFITGGDVLNLFNSNTKNN